MAEVDIEKLEELDKSIFPKDEPYPKKGCYWWIVEVDGKPVGFAGIKVFGKTAFLCRAGVKKGYRGRGIHKILIKVREKFCKNHLAVDTIATYVAFDNIRSMNNLIQSGYLAYKPPKKWLGITIVPEVFFRKCL